MLTVEIKDFHIFHFQLKSDYFYHPIFHKVPNFCQMFQEISSLTASSKVIHIDQTHSMAVPSCVHCSDCVPLISAWVVLEDLVF